MIHSLVLKKLNQKNWSFFFIVCLVVSLHFFLIVGSFFYDVTSFDLKTIPQKRLIVQTVSLAVKKESSQTFPIEQKEVPTEHEMAAEQVVPTESLKDDRVVEVLAIETMFEPPKMTEEIKSNLVPGNNSSLKEAPARLPKSPSSNVIFKKTGEKLPEKKIVKMSPLQSSSSNSKNTGSKEKSASLKNPKPKKITESKEAISPALKTKKKTSALANVEKAAIESKKKEDEEKLAQKIRQQQLLGEAREKMDKISQKFLNIEKKVRFQQLPSQLFLRPLLLFKLRLPWKGGL